MKMLLLIFSLLFSMIFDHHGSDDKSVHVEKIKTEIGEAYYTETQP